MNSCEEIWAKDRWLKVTQSDQNQCSQILSQASPSLIRILQAIKFLQLNWFPLLSKIHFLLDFWWDELRTVICSLCSPMHDEGKEFMRTLSAVALDLTLFPMPFDLIIWDLACASLRVMQQIIRGELDKYIV
jgi:hypothetical protein